MSDVWKRWRESIYGELEGLRELRQRLADVAVPERDVPLTMYEEMDERIVRLEALAAEVDKEGNAALNQQRDRLSQTIEPLQRFYEALRAAERLPHGTPVEIASAAIGVMGERARAFLDAAGDWETPRSVYGLPGRPLPPGWMVVGGMAALRTVDPEGQRRITFRPVGEVMAWEVLALAEVMADDARREIDTTRENPDA